MREAPHLGAEALARGTAYILPHRNFTELNLACDSMLEAKPACMAMPGRAKAECRAARAWGPSSAHPYFKDKLPTRPDTTSPVCMLSCRRRGSPLGSFKWLHSRSSECARLTSEAACSSSPFSVPDTNVNVSPARRKCELQLISEQEQ